jgi:hypothetical protein
MTGDGGYSGAFEGIDPGQLAQLMQSMKSSVAAAQPVASGYLGRFNALGLDTSRVSRLLQDYSWAQGQQPMLQRRYDLASHQPSGQWQQGMATNGAGELEYSTPQQAQKAGANAAQQLQDGKITDAEFLALLREHEDDPDWQTGAMRELGDAGARQVCESIAAGDQTDYTALAMALAAAMANGVTFPAPGLDDPDIEDLGLLAPLLQLANFPPQVLADLGKQALTPGYYGMYASTVWAALAANPEAAALFVKQDAPQIVSFLGGQDPMDLQGDQADQFLAVLKAGTITIKNTDPQLGGQAVSALVQAYDGNSSAHAPSAFEGLYGQVIEDYWPDVMTAVTDKTGTNGGLASPDGMKLSLGQWAPFVAEAMRNPTAAKQLLAEAYTQGDAWMSLAARQPPGTIGSSDAGDVDEWNAGFVEGFFSYQAKEAYSELLAEGANAGAWKSTVSTVAGDVVNTAFNVLVDPGQAAGTIAKSFTQDALDLLTSHVIDDLPSGGSPPPAPNYVNFLGTYASNAANFYNETTPADTDAARAALVASAKGQPFVVNGQIPQTSKMTEQQLAAYDNWLNSPAVFSYFNHPGAQGAWQSGYDAIITQDMIDNQGSN